MRVIFMLFVAATLVSGVAAQDPAESVCLVTDIGQIDDGTFNQYAYEGLVDAVEDFDLDEPVVIETQSETDYEANIGTCVGEDVDAIVSVGFLLQDATLEAAIANPNIYFIGIDQDMSGIEDAPENYVGIQFREAQGGFLMGALAALVANEEGRDVVAGIYGIDVPAVVRFRNGYEQGAKYINPDWEVGVNILGNYENSFDDPTVGISAANQYLGEGATVIFGAGGYMGLAGIAEAAQQGAYVIGVDQDVYFTIFQDEEGLPIDGAENLISSAIKRVDQGVYDMLAILAEGDFEDFPGGENYVLGVENGGIGYAPKHDADVSDAYFEQLDEILAGLIDGSIETGVDPVSGDLLEDMDEMEDMEDTEAEG